MNFVKRFLVSSHVVSCGCPSWLQSPKFPSPTAGEKELFLFSSVRRPKRIRSPALIPKPPDWGDHIHVAGFYFLQLASTFTPDPKLVEFLEAGPPPVYIGFGSIVVADPDAM